MTASDSLSFDINNKTINNLSSFNENKLEAALYYAEVLGWKIFPCHTVNEDGNCSCGNLECTNEGKHPHIFDWQQKATDNPNIIKAWWDKWPDANIGLPTGLKNNIFVLDVDGYDYLEENKLSFNKDNNNQTVTSTTGGGGQHVLYRYNEDLIEFIGKEIGNRVKFLPGLDLRAKGGFIILPPSDHLSGKKYEWELEPGKYNIEEPPKWLIEALRQKTSSGRKKLSFSESPVVPNGQRNDTLFNYARNQWSLGLSEEEVFASVELLNQNKCEEPLPEHEIICLVQSAENYVERNDIFNQIAKNFINFNDEGKPKSINFTELTKFILNNNEIYRIKEFKTETFLIYNKNLGIFEKSPHAWRTLEKQAKDALGDYVSFWKTSAKNDFHTVLAPEIRNISLEEFDRQRHLIVCGNGVIDLRSKQLLPFDPKHKFTLRTPVNYDPEAKSDLLERFLDDICCLTVDGLDNEESKKCEELREYMHIIDGYALTGEVSEQEAYFPFSSGGSGKSLHMDIKHAVMAEYSCTIPESVIASKRGLAREPYEIANLRGVRSVKTSEVSQGSKLNVELLKTVTGDTYMSARGIRMDPFNLEILFKLFILGNNELHLGIQDNASGRRVRVLPYKMMLRPEEVDKHLKDKILEDKEAVLNYLVEGAYKYYNTERIEIPELVLEASEDYSKNVDSLKGFFDACLVKSEDGFIASKDAYDYYVTFANSENFASFKLSEGVFYQNLRGQMSTKGIAPGRPTVDGKKVSGYKGYTISPLWLAKVGASEGQVEGQARTP